jgi:hypothetical protein
MVIGSVHTCQINYKRNQPFFIDYKLKDSVREAKDYIKEMIKDADLFELKKKRWNASILTPRSIGEFGKEVSQKAKLFNIRLGLSDGSPVRGKGNKIYMGT